MTYNCKLPKKDDSKENIFQTECGADIFKKYRPEWHPEIKDYLNVINKIKDLILRHISLYFVQYYIEGYHYYHDSGPSHRGGACLYLKNWLQEKKDLFTYGETCPTKMKLWEDNFKHLWNKLEEDYSIKNNGGISWCNNKYPLLQKTEYPQGLAPFNYDESVSQETSNTNRPPSPVQAPSSCPSCPPCVNSAEAVTSLQTDHSPETVLPQEVDRTKNLAVTSGFTAAGTLGTLFFLYRFTPMMSWFRRPGMNNVGTDLYMNPGGAESFLSMQKDNGSNNLFYHP